MAELSGYPAGAPVVRIRVGAGTDRTVDVPFAGTALRRLRGLLLGGDQLLLHPCTSVHGLGMRRALEVAYIGRDGTVLDVAPLRPWTMHLPRKGAVAVWETPPGELTALGVRPGTVLGFETP